ncbi:MAG: ABC transporter permease [Porphyromonas sp.]|nr:ABC transporter permease [Porphyromonas sp.]
MKQFLAFVKKEFLHIPRDKWTLRFIIGMPIAMVLLFGFALNMEVTDIRTAIYTPENNDFIIDIGEKLDRNQYFTYKGISYDLDELSEMLKRGALDAVIVMDPSFLEEVAKGQDATLQVLINGSEPNRATIVQDYITAIVMERVLTEAGIESLPFQITTETRMLFNPEMRSTFLYVPGIMGLVFMIISTMLTSVSIVREKERGTMEVLLASPLEPLTMILAKTVPYLVFSFLNLVTILLLSIYVLKVPMQGSFLLFMLVSTIFILLSLALGLAISNLVDVQINAVFISAITIMVPTIILSGMLFPVNNMPTALQIASYLTPARWYISAVRKVMIQGQGFVAIWQEVVILVGMMLSLFGVTLLTTKRRL